MCLDGIWTAPEHFLGDYPAVKFERFHDTLPASLKGLSVLDIGCNAGFYSLEMKSRGAARVLGIDTDSRYLQQARLAASVRGLEIEYRQLGVWDVAQLHETFDIVIFMGVFYHLRHPLLALDLIHEHCTRDLFLFQSMQRGSRELIPLKSNYSFENTEVFDQDAYPKMHFIERSYCDDQTNWWVPNRAATEAMLRSSGFGIISHPEEEVYLCRHQDSPSDGASRPIYPARP